MASSRDNYINKPSLISWELKYLLNAEQPLIFFDIGACEGLDSIRYKKLFPNAWVTAFEPLTENIKIIKTNIEKYASQNITIEPYALSDEKGEMTFYVSSGHPDKLPNNEEWNYGNKSSSLLPPQPGTNINSWLKYRKVEGIQVSTLYDYCKNKDIRYIDFVHMDVQGAELNVLKGAGYYLSNIKIIWMEVEKVELYKKQPLKKEVENFMYKNQFVKVKDTVGGVSGDQLYVNKRFFKKRKILRCQLHNLFPILF